MPKHPAIPVAPASRPRPAVAAPFTQTPSELSRSCLLYHNVSRSLSPFSYMFPFPVSPPHVSRPLASFLSLSSSHLRHPVCPSFRPSSISLSLSSTSLLTSASLCAHPLARFSLFPLSLRLPSSSYRPSSLVSSSSLPCSPSHLSVDFLVLTSPRSLPPSASRQLSPPLQWEVEKQIGRGSFAVVWRARHVTSRTKAGGLLTTNTLPPYIILLLLLRASVSIHPESKTCSILGSFSLLLLLRASAEAFTLKGNHAPTSAHSISSSSSALLRKHSTWQQIMLQPRLVQSLSSPSTLLRKHSPWN